MKNNVFNFRKGFNMKHIKRYIGMMLALITLITPSVNASAAEWVLQTGTKLEEAGKYYEFCLGDYNGDGTLDLYAIKKSATGSRSTEVHVLNGKSNFQEFLLQTGTKLEEAGEHYEFCLGDYNGDGTLDLYAIKKSVTGSRSTEVHVLNGKSNFQEFLLQTGTKLEEAGEHYEFCLGDYNGDGTLDLYAIKKSVTGSRSTEVHVLNGKSNFQEFLLQTGTKLEEAEEHYEFCLGDYNGDGTLDLYAIKKSATGSKSTEIHVLNGKSNFQEFLLQTGTKLEEAGKYYEFCLGDYNGDGTLDLYAIKKSATGSRTTEVHTLTIDGSQIQQKADTNKKTDSENTSNISNNAFVGLVGSKDRNALITVAQNEVGYKESNNNRTKYNEWYYGHNASAPWCAIFVSWCARNASIDTSVIPNFASCSAGKQWFENRNQFHYRGTYIPKPGDLIFFSGHVGIVKSCNGNSVQTIEGNTSNQVAERSYSLNSSKIIGYAVPAY